MPYIDRITNIISDSRGEGPVIGGPNRRTWTSSKERYHHGSLVNSAVQRGLQLVAQFGPMAVTMRGLARELGVTAAALVHYFHNRSGLLGAIAEAAAAQMRPFSVVRSGGLRAGERLRNTAQSWVAFAAQNPNLYRVVFGEGWRDGQTSTAAGRECIYSVDRIASMGQVSGHIRDGSPREHGLLFFSAVHGLALARADGGLPEQAVGPLIDRFVQAIESTKDSLAPVAPRKPRLPSRA